MAHPKSWSARHLRDLIVNMKNGIPETQNVNQKGIKVTRIETISNGVIDCEKIGFVDGVDDYSRFKLEIGDILFSHINSVSHIGKIALYDKDYGLYHGVNLTRLKPNTSIVNYKFLFYHLKNHPAKYFYERRAKQAVNQASLDQSDIGSLPLAIPNLATQAEIVNGMQKYDECLENVITNIRAAQTVQNGLINKVF
jgi:type I restriction enzyme S subunit